MFDYLRDPEEIYRRSFAIVRAETNLPDWPTDIAAIARRLTHACGMPDIVADLAWSVDAASAGSAALARGAPVLCDARMVVAGIAQNRLPRANAVLCRLDGVASGASAPLAMTRSAAAVELWRGDLDGAVVAIGNAPTALFRLIELMAEGAPKPAAIFAFPVGFVGAAEAKEALIATGEVPFMTLRGRRGGSALAAAAINALAAGDDR